MKKVLVCDDDKDVRYFMTFALTGLDWEVVTCEDCINIVEKVIEHQPSAIIMDNLIPDIGGFLAIQTLRSNPISKDIPVILCSSDLGINNLVIEAGADFYLPKPVDIKKLGRMMKESYNLFLMNNPGKGSTEVSELA
jgi:two-component system cell cycle response regulator DivK